ncbi:MAG: TetR/AcrR family transcriptional regulator [Dehalococcoidia bacterium]|nr:MAG: TetR/AcrR family transcriptional regulator [Dehalococcoidia bacterium]
MAKMRNRLPAEKRRKQILKCSVKVFARSNYRKTRVADIAAEAGISEAMIYKHFPSKKSIFIEILHDMSERIISRLREEGNREQDALEAIRNMAKTFYNLIISHPDEVKVQFQAISEIDDSEIADRLHRDHEDYMRFIGSIIERGIQQGTFRKDLDVGTMVLLLDGVGVFIELMKLLSFEEQFTEETAVRMTDSLIELMRA